MHRYDLRRVRKTVVVTFAGRSGSFLLQNLLDYHSQVLSHPSECLNKLPHYIYDLFVNNESKALLNENKEPFAALALSADEIASFVRQITEIVPEIFTDLLQNDDPLAKLFTDSNRAAWGYSHEFDHLGDTHEDLSFNEKVEKMGVDREVFIRIAQEILGEHMASYQILLPSDVFSLIIFSYNLAKNNRSFPVDPVIVWQKHLCVWEHEIPRVEATVPNPLYITTVRCPHEALDSHLAHYVRLGDKNPFNPFKTKAEAYYWLVNNFVQSIRTKPLQGPQYGIRFEDMHRKTESVMAEVCQLAGISWEPILGSTTLNGEVMEFTTYRNHKKVVLTGVNKDLKPRAAFETLSSDDILLLKILFARFYKQYDYEIKRPLKRPNMANCIIGIGGFSNERDGILTAEFPEFIKGISFNLSEVPKSKAA
ncbi:MAG: hypothetical protein CMM58_05590 [Rhodospirillaceae bacterium]|nr:hypothetical protein [Rhodospirillaceae bacterium]|tara:strand:+ start:549 stop:1817 length:1269 start_codon:yes stop_codon:yes gene_type:complete